MAAMMSEAIKTCDGEFTAATTTQSIDGKSVVTGDSSCLEGDYELIDHFLNFLNPTEIIQFL